MTRTKWIRVVRLVSSVLRSKLKNKNSFQTLWGHSECFTSDTKWNKMMFKLFNYKQKGFMHQFKRKYLDVSSLKQTETEETECFCVLKSGFCAVVWLRPSDCSFMFYFLRPEVLKKISSLPDVRLLEDKILSPSGVLTQTRCSHLTVSSISSFFPLLLRFALGILKSSPGSFRR